MMLNINNTHPTYIRLLIAVGAALLFIPFLGGMHLFDWDEINFAESAREMIVTGDFLTVRIDFQPFWEKPPLFIWMQVLSMKLFGINEFAARFPNAVCGIVTLLILFNTGRKIHNNLFGILWVLAYTGSILPFFYFKSGIIDPWFNLFIFLGIYYLMLYADPDDLRKQRNVMLAGLFTGLAVLTKGPVGFLLVGLTGGVYLLWIRFRIKVKVTHVLLFFLVMAITGGSWFIMQVLSGHAHTVIDFIVYQVRLFQTQDAGHGGFPGYHFVVLLFGVFPASLMAIKAFRNESDKNAFYSLMKKWMVILFWVVLILFSIVKTKIVHYSSMAYFPLTFLAAAFVYNAHKNRMNWSKWLSVSIFVFSVLIALPVIGLQFVEKFKDRIIGSDIIDDPFAVENLKADVHWSGMEFLPGALFLLSVIIILVGVSRKEPLKKAILLFSVNTLFILSVILIMVPKVEKYSQNALIEFFKSKADEDVYLKNLHFKSYAIWFYGKTQPERDSRYSDPEWLLTGDIDKDVYFVTKVHLAHLVEGYEEVQETGRKNGFVFYVRRAR